MNKFFLPDTKILSGQLCNGYKIVAVIGWVSDWAAYAGKIDSSIEEIASYGDKISESIARFLFPQLHEYSYRE